MPQTTAFLSGYLMPHPPVIIPAVNRRDRQLAGLTIRAMQQVADQVAAQKPETIVVISPHAPIFSDFLFFLNQSELSGDFSAFGAEGERLTFRQDELLLQAMIDQLAQAGIPAGTLDDRQMTRFHLDSHLDHGVMVPMWYVTRRWPDVRLVALSCSGLPLDAVYRAGQAMARAIEQVGHRTIVIASGDLSHKVTADSPYGSCPEGETFDRDLVDSLNRSDLAGLLSLDDETRQRAAECGYRSLVMLSGVIDKRLERARVLSSEAPYGIGYAVAAFEIRRAAADNQQGAEQSDPWDQALQIRHERIRQKTGQGSWPVRLAVQALETLVRTGRTADPAQVRENLPPSEQDLVKRRAGVFVSLKKHGDLRGCIGTILATEQDLVAEIMHNAVQAGLHDPRFEPVTEEELPDLEYHVDILEPAEIIADESMLDPRRYGVIVRQGSRSGLLLPDLEGVDTIEQQIAIACRKGSIDRSDPYRLERFKVTRHA